MKHSTYKIIVTCIVLLLIGFVNYFPSSGDDSKAETIQQGIAEEIIRLHVIANSDSEEDQALKRKVKDEIVKTFSDTFSNANSKEEARQLISENLSQIEEVALATMKNEGYDYTVKASLSNEYFPVKTYGKYTLPCGTYEALRVELGKAEGKNWWCIMFPPLCFVSSTYSLVPDQTDLKLKHLLTQAEYDEIIQTPTKVRVKFKVIEYIKELL